MAVIHRSSSSNDGKSGSHNNAYDTEKGGAPYGGANNHDHGYGVEQPIGHIRGIETSEETSLHRGLKARHITMIAIGGAIGTGLIIGTGKALAQAGPGSVFISYTIVGFIVFLVMAALGEMAAWLPMSAGFTGYASRFCDPSLGFALGWRYVLGLHFAQPTPGNPTFPFPRDSFFLLPQFPRNFPSFISSCAHGRYCVQVAVPAPWPTPKRYPRLPIYPTVEKNRGVRPQIAPKMVCYLHTVM
jgi:hypothetical protein